MLTIYLTSIQFDWYCNAALVTITTLTFIEKNTTELLNDRQNTNLKNEIDGQQISFTFNAINCIINCIPRYPRLEHFGSHLYLIDLIRWLSLLLVSYLNSSLVEWE